MDSFGGLDRLEGFARIHGREFYGLDTAIDLVSGTSRKPLALGCETRIVKDSFVYVDDDGVEREIVPYKRGKELKF